MSSKGLADTVYDDASYLGTFQFIKNIIVGGIFSIIFLILGLYFLLRKKIYTMSTVATINRTLNQKNCNFYVKNNNNTSQGFYNCTLQLSYVVNNKTYESIANIDSNINYDNLNTIKIYYNPNNPEDLSISGDPPKWLGILFLVIALIIIAYCIFSYFIMKKSKFARAAAGVGLGYGLVKGM
jgi:hypothetical protein